MQFHSDGRKLFPTKAVDPINGDITYTALSDGNTLDSLAVGASI